ncbi:uncharacterized protein C8Q71DRAFT_795348 [Rhodofomes roseus]|uniref:EF-hand domain-containing protein n=1 Tax=Rhodofomes roseus TaxID=34475 RepID=A0ABQ8KPR9_9APHY|nr:uncharacterized protein C8Q71DRAFT_795348 [Rhodofomes roseus]KAH9840219.1 hypothetical protein C8Q71DRAFT_795348 [Rhodofomes roseus]
MQTLPSASGSQEPEDPGFAALPSRLRRRIDRAFEEALDSVAGPPRKRRRRDADPDPGTGAAAPEAGGFLLDDESGGDQPGGFLVDTAATPEGSVPDSTAEDDDSGTAENEANVKLPLSLIPHALQLLDLQPDDEDVLAVFRHAASGWEDQARSRSRPDTSDEPYVGRKDWRAVCAALLGGDEDDTGVDDGRPIAEDASNEGGELTPLESSDSEDEYEASELEGDPSDAEDNASDDEYQEGGFIATRARGKESATIRTSKRPSRKPRSSLATSDDDEETGDPRTHPLTARQRLESRRTFALFFPDMPDSQLDKQRIMIKDITRAAKLLKEKITAEETVEMLEMFSSSADKSMSLQDFERMMMTAKLA